MMLEWSRDFSLEVKVGCDPPALHSRDKIRLPATCTLVSRGIADLLKKRVLNRFITGLADACLEAISGSTEPQARVCLPMCLYCLTTGRSTTPSHTVSTAREASGKSAICFLRTSEFFPCTSSEMAGASADFRSALWTTRRGVRRLVARGGAVHLPHRWRASPL